VADASVLRAPKEGAIACMVAAGTAVLLTFIVFAIPHRPAPRHEASLTRGSPAQRLRETSIAKSAKPQRPPTEAMLTPQTPAPRASEGAKTEPGHAPGFESETGRASWYDLASATASGETMDGGDLTAAHPFLPMGTHVLVENLDNGRSVIVRINDRGPFTGKRIIDVSRAAAEKLGMVAKGIARVRVSRIEAVEAGLSAPN